MQKSSFKLKDGILELAKEKGIYTIEDNAQAIGAVFNSKLNGPKKTGTMGTIGTTSFFPSKNLGCYGDGGAIFTNDASLSEKIAMIANHGQKRKYFHSVIGCNSRLDALQAAVLNVKLKDLDSYASARQKVAKKYDEAFGEMEQVIVPERLENSTHVFHQYTLKIRNGKRDALKDYLNEHGVPCMIYYPVPLYKQEAFAPMTDVKELSVTEQLCKDVLSLPIHTEMKPEVQTYIIQTLHNFYNS